MMINKILRILYILALAIIQFVLIYSLLMFSKSLDLLERGFLVFVLLFTVALVIVLLKDDRKRRLK